MVGAARRRVAAQARRGVCRLGLVQDRGVGLACETQGTGQAAAAIHGTAAAGAHGWRGVGVHNLTVHRRSFSGEVSGVVAGRSLAFSGSRSSPQSHSQPGVSGTMSSSVTAHRTSTTARIVSSPSSIPRISSPRCRAQASASAGYVGSPSLRRTVNQDRSVQWTMPSRQLHRSSQSQRGRDALIPSAIRGEPSHLAADAMRTRPLRLVVVDPVQVAAVGVFAGGAVAGKRHAMHAAQGTARLLA